MPGQPGPETHGVAGVGALGAPDWATIAREKKHKGVTLHLLWQEYRSVDGDGYSYSQFAELYRRWRRTLDPVLRQEYRARERAFVDYAGMTVDVVDPSTGEVRTAQIFVAALGASNYTYAEATWTQQLPDWIASHVRMLESFGGAPTLIIPTICGRGSPRRRSTSPKSMRRTPTLPHTIPR